MNIQFMNMDDALRWYPKKRDLLSNCRIRFGKINVFIPIHAVFVWDGFFSLNEWMNTIKKKKIHKIDHDHHKNIYILYSLFTFVYFLTVHGRQSQTKLCKKNDYKNEKIWRWVRILVFWLVGRLCKSFKECFF